MDYNLILFAVIALTLICFVLTIVFYVKSKNHINNEFTSLFVIMQKNVEELYGRVDRMSNEVNEYIDEQTEYNERNNLYINNMCASCGVLNMIREDIRQGKVIKHDKCENKCLADTAYHLVKAKKHIKKACA